MEKDFQKILPIATQIQNSTQFDLNRLFLAYSNYDHPWPLYELGVRLLIAGKRSEAIKCLQKAAGYGLEFQSDAQMIDYLSVEYIGQSLVLLLTECNSNLSDSGTFKLNCICHLYLSQVLYEIKPKFFYDSYYGRGKLFSQHKKSWTIEMFGTKYFLGAIREVFIISDYYYASIANESPHVNTLTIAHDIHYHLGDLAISRKPAFEYSLKELAEIGESRHKSLYSKIKPEYISGEISLTFKELDFQ